MWEGEPRIPAVVSMKTRKRRIDKALATVAVIWIVIAVVWFANFPLKPLADGQDAVVEIIELAAVIVAGLFVRRLGDRALGIGWSLFGTSRLLDTLEEFTWQSALWGTTIPGIIGTAGVLFTAIGFYFSYKRLGQELGRSRRAEEALRSSQRALSEALAASESAAQVKSQFLANMSHEIRTPLNGVVGMAQLLRETRLDTEQQEYVEIVESSSRALLSIINDILDLSKIEAGKLELNNIELDLRTLVEEASQVVAGPAQEKGLELICAVANNVPSLVQGDPDRLRQILINLLGNAIKFTAQGEVSITLSCVGKQTAPLFRFEVRDTGIGIAPSDHGRVFAAFTQADGSTTRRFGGTGLGLSICKQLVEKMGGILGLQSEVGKGSLFWFEIPLAILSTTSEIANKLDPARVLLVERNASSRRALRWLCESCGLVVAEATGLPGAQELLERERSSFSAILADIATTHWDWLAHIRRTPALASVPLIAMVGLGHPVPGEARPSATLRKPIKRQQLLELMARLIGSGTRIGRPQDVPVHAFHSHGSILIVDDHVINQRVAQRLLQKLGFEPDVVGSGLEALDALTRRDYSLVFMDCQMPGIDGFEATREIRRRERDRAHTAIVAMTANAMQGDRERCLEAGMDDYIPKPVTLAQLAQALARFNLARPDGAPQPQMSSGEIARS